MLSRWSGKGGGGSRVGVACGGSVREACMCGSERSLHVGVGGSVKVVYYIMLYFIHTHVQYDIMLFIFNFLSVK